MKKPMSIPEDFTVKSMDTMPDGFTVIKRKITRGRSIQSAYISVSNSTVYFNHAMAVALGIQKGSSCLFASDTAGNMYLAVRKQPNGGQYAPNSGVNLSITTGKNIAFQCGAKVVQRMLPTLVKGYYILHFSHEFLNLHWMRIEATE